MKAKLPPNYIDYDENIVDEDPEDDDFIVKPGNKKKKDTVLLELPKDIMNSPEVCAMLDKTGTTSRKAIGVVSSILKSGKIDGKDADLSSFSLSRAGLERKRVQNRTVLMEHAIEEFKLNKPKLAALHWDGAMFKDITGILQEHESILVSGAPHYMEGRHYINFLEQTNLQFY